MSEPPAVANMLPGEGLGSPVSAEEGIVAAAAPAIIKTRRSILGRILSNAVLRGLVVPVLVLVAWQLITSTHAVKSVFLPSPSEVLRGWKTWAFGQTSPISWVSGTFFHYCVLSMRRVYLGFAIGAAFGVVFGILIGWFKIVSDLFEPFIQALRPIPMTAWLPFATILFGIQETAAVFLIAMGCFFPVVVNTTDGARQTPRLLVRAALMLGTKPHRLLYRVVLPYALPSIITGLRLGLGIAWVLVIVAEILAVRGGLGFAIWGAYEYLRMDLILAAIITLGFLGWGSDRLLLLVARWPLRWQKELVHE